MDITTLKTADGKPIDTSKIDPGTLALVSALGAALPGVVAEAATKAVEPVTTKLTETFEGKLAELAKAPKPDPANPNPKPGDKPGDKKDDVDPNAPPAWFKPFAEKVDKLSESYEGDRTRATVTQQAEAYLAKNHPRINPNARKRLLDAIVGKAPKDEAGIKAVVEDERERAIAYGADKAKPFGADVEAEGGAPAQDADQEAAKKQAILDELKSDAKQKQA